MINPLTDDSTGIYALENLHNGRAYVGATKKGFRQRQRNHFSVLHRKVHIVPAMRQDILRYGACGFRFCVLQPLPSSISMAPFERFWIDYLRSLGVDCYNTHLANEIRYPRVVLNKPVDIPTASHYLSLQDMAKQVHLPVSSIRARISDGTLQAIRVGKHLRVRRDIFAAFVRSSQVIPRVIENPPDLTP